MSARNVLVIAGGLSDPAGGPIYALRVLRELVDAGDAVTIWTIKRISQPGLKDVSWHESPRYFRHGHGFIQKLHVLNEELRLLKLVRATRPAHCLILGDRPRTIHRLLSLWTNVVFFTHDASFSCPQGKRFLERSGRVCTQMPGTECLKTDRVEGCLGEGKSWRKLQRIWRTCRAMKILGQLDHVVANSDYVAGLYRREGSRVKLHVLSPRIESLNGHPRSSEEENQRRNVLYLGRVETYKGAVEAVEVLSLLPQPYRLHVAGMGEANDLVLKRAAELGLSHRVHLLGWKSGAEISEEFHRTGVLLLPTLCAEAFGMVGPEALLAGVPVVAYDAGGVRSWCDGAAARHVPVGDRAAAAKEILDITTDARQWRRLCTTARIYATQHFDPADWRSQFFQILGEREGGAA